MPKMTDEQRKALKAKWDALDADERKDMLDLFGASHSDDLMKTVEQMQKDIEDLKGKKSKKGFFDFDF